MKIRKGFVSNSSSSSFIIATKKGQNRFNITVEADISSFATKIQNKDQLDSYFLSEYDCGDYKTIDVLLKEEDKFVVMKYKKILETIQSGKDVWIGMASYNESDNPIELFIGNGGLSNVKDVDILFNDNE